MEKYQEGFVRKEIYTLLPKKKELRILDLGCSHGDTGAWLKENGYSSFIAGIELDPLAAKNAAQKLDAVVTVNIDGIGKIPFPEKSFDLVLCLDVLEHLQDPWLALQKIRSVLVPGGEIIASIPNVRNFRVLIPLIVKGEWTYTDSGLLDRTHLRFFTKKTALDLFTQNGFTLEQIETTGAKFPGISFLLNILTLGIFRNFFVIQYLLRAKMKQN